VRSSQQPHDFFLQRAPRLHQFTSILNHFSHPSRTVFRLHKEEVRLGHPTSFGKPTIFFFFSQVVAPMRWVAQAQGLAGLNLGLYTGILLMMTVKVCNINYKTPNTITKGIIN
jgi:hypothetical protein